MDKRAEIEKIAYELYQKYGCIHGHDLEYWVEAEKIVHSRQTAIATAMPASKKEIASKEPTAKKVAAKKKSTTANSKLVAKITAKTKSLYERTW